MALTATRCEACGANYQRALRVARGEPATDAPEEFEFEKSAMNGGVVGGIGAMCIGVVWFLVGYFMLHRVFFYAPVLVVIGFIGVVNGFSETSRQRNKGRPRGRYRD